MRIEGIGLDVDARRQIEAEAGANQRLTRLGIGIRSKDPPLVPPIAENLNYLTSLSWKASRSSAVGTR